MSARTAELKTVGRIASDLGQPLHRVVYAIRSRQIPPTARVGGLRAFDAAAVARVVEALRRTDLRKGVGDADAPAPAGG